MTSGLRSFARFWYEFVVGDDWLVAAGVVAALGATAAVSHVGAPAWWVLPVAILALLPFSLWRATRGARPVRR